MNILLSNTSDRPIYDQIFGQIQNAILTGQLRPGEALPSIRGLARDLRVSVITTKRAYEELERAGLVVTVPGKGSYVAQPDTQRIREGYLTQIEDHFSQSLTLAARCGLSTDELIELLRTLAQELPEGGSL